MIRALACAVLGASLVMSSACATPKVAADTPRAQILDLLSSRHQLPARDRFEAAAPEPAKLLRAIAVDPSVPDLQRYAAYEALGWWPDDATFALYVEAVAPAQKAGQRHRVMRYLALAFGERALAPLTATLTGDGDPQIRLTAATAIADIPGDAARAALTAASKSDEAAVVRQGIERLLQRGGALR